MSPFPPTPSSLSSPRLAYVDKGWLRMLTDEYRRLTTKETVELAAESVYEPIGRWASAADHRTIFALLLYAAGAPLPEVRDVLESAARAEVAMLTLRGPRRDDLQEAQAPRSFSDGTSCQALRAIEAALAAGCHDLARSMAPLVWDPAWASYIGPGSVVCTNKQQAIAYAVRDLLLGDDAAAATELKRLAMVPEELVGPLKMLRGLLAKQAARFLEGLSTTLAWHEREARKQPNPKRPEFFMCLVGLGLAALALQQGVVTRDQLVSDNVYFPRDLIAPA
jgi:hypothetical protein